MNSRRLLCATLALTLLGLGASLRRGPVTFSMDVPAGKWKVFRLRNLPEGAIVSVNVQTSGEIAVGFVDAADFRRLPVPAHPLFTGRVESRLAFSVTMPAAGTYFLVFHNLSPSEARTIAVSVRAAPAPPRDRKEDTLTFHPPPA